MIKEQERQLKEQEERLKRQEREAAIKEQERQLKEHGELSKCQELGENSQSQQKETSLNTDLEDEIAQRPKKYTGSTNESAIDEQLTSKLDNSLGLQDDYSYFQIGIAEIRKIFAQYVASSNDFRSYVSLTENKDRISKVINSYAKISSDELPVVVYDNTVFGKCKEGFLITTKRIYIKNMMESVVVLDLNSLYSIDYKSSFFNHQIILNGFPIDIEMMNKKEGGKKLFEFLSRILIIRE